MFVQLGILAVRCASGLYTAVWSATSSIIEIDLVLSANYTTDDIVAIIEGKMKTEIRQRKKKRRQREKT